MTSPVFGLLAALALALAALSTGCGGDDDESAGADKPPAAGGRVPQLLLAKTPDGLSLATRKRLPLPDQTPSTRVVLLQPENGPVVGLVLADVGHQDPVSGATATVHGQPAVIGSSGAFTTVGWREPSGLMVQAMARGVASEDVVRVAEGTTISGDGAEVKPPPGHTVAANVSPSPVPGLGSVTVSPKAEGYLVSYTDRGAEAGAQRVVAYAAHRANADFLAVMRWWLDDAKPAKVRDKSGVTGRLAYIQNQASLVVLAWPESDGVVVTMTFAGFEPDAALRTAGDLRPADDAEWDKFWTGA